MPIPSPVPRTGVVHSRVSVATARSDPVSASAARPFDLGDNDALLDSLHDLEVGPVMRGWLVEYLKLELGKA